MCLLKTSLKHDLRVNLPHQHPYIIAIICYVHLPYRLDRFLEARRTLSFLPFMRNQLLDSI